MITVVIIVMTVIIVTVILVIMRVMIILVTIIVMMIKAMKVKKRCEYGDAAPKAAKCRPEKQSSCWCVRACVRSCTEKDSLISP